MPGEVPLHLITNWHSLFCSKYAEIWTQAKPFPSSANWEPASRGAWEIKPGNKIEWICSWALSSKYPKVYWCEDQWNHKNGLAYLEGIVVALWKVAQDCHSSADLLRFGSIACTSCVRNDKIKKRSKRMVLTDKTLVL